MPSFDPEINRRWEDGKAGVLSDQSNFAEIHADRTDLRRLREYAERHRLGDSATALRHLLDGHTRAMEALEFYADPKQYEVDGPLIGGAWGSPHYPIDDDRGERARVAIDDKQQ